MTKSMLYVPALGMVMLSFGCATTPEDPAQVLQAAERPAWSLESGQDEFIVAASPMGKTLRLAGSTGLIIGTGVDLVVNSEFRSDVRNALGDYKPEEVFRAHIAQRMGESLPAAAQEVPPMQSSAGYANTTEARKARFSALARQGYDALLNLELRYGLYGTEAELVAELDAALISLPTGRRLWSTTVFANPRPALASDRLGDPQKKKRSRESAPQFSVDKAAFERWTADSAAALRREYVEAVTGVTSALLAEMGLATDAIGEHYLGKVAMSRKDFAGANKHFETALRIAPELTEAANARAVNYAQAGQVKEAVDLTAGILQAHPDYAPAAYNLAWWYAVDLKDPAQAKPYYDQALSLGMAPDPKIEEALSGK